jgi:hypothetical protein
MTGISLAARNVTSPGAKPRCGSVSLRNPGGQFNSTDLVAEHDIFVCPKQDNTHVGGILGGYTVVNCSHCSIRV